jgi:pimeloyl-ACP methyl ester carboxylesterase
MVARAALLIHGAWQGAWSWDAFIPPFAALGWGCHAVDLPENGQPGAGPGRASLETYVAHCASHLDGPTILIAHSGAGVIASQLAEDHPDKVAGVVYLAGMMLPSGMAFEDLLRDLPPEENISKGIDPHLVWSEDGQFSTVPVQAALDIFLHDCPPAAARRAAESLRPQRETGRQLRARLTAERHGRVPRLYVEALHDRSVVLDVQRRMQRLSPGAASLTMETGHVPQLARPETLAHRLDEALAALG